MSNFSYGYMELTSLYHAPDHDIDVSQDNIKGCMVLL